MNRSHKSSKKPSGTKFDQGKPRVDLVSKDAIFGLANVLGFGASKYSSHNWRNGINYSRLIAAALRHIHQFNNGESTDPESGESHIDHAMCNLMFLSHFIKNQPELDDRYKQENGKEKKDRRRQNRRTRKTSKDTKVNKSRSSKKAKKSR